jgi:hypothetical protein
LIRKRYPKAYERFGYEAAELVVRCGGSLSGEHGDGQSRGELLSIMFGKDLMNAFHECKRIWDPEWKMNPGKVVSPYGKIQGDEFRYSGRPPSLRFGAPWSSVWYSRITWPRPRPCGVGLQPG